jgi:nicotinamide-nucleotide amidase
MAAESRAFRALIRPRFAQKIADSIRIASRRGAYFVCISYPLRRYCRNVPRRARRIGAAWIRTEYGMALDFSRGGLFPPDLADRAAAALQSFRARGLRLATAESCTGGLVAALLTEIAGSSDVVERGFVTYSNDAKRELLGVRAETLAAHGAVSEATAREMAAGALGASRADIAVSITGVAGPGGGGAEKPVGLVHFACYGPGERRVAVERRFGDLGRGAVRLAAVEQALALLTAAAGGAD